MHVMLILAALTSIISTTPIFIMVDEKQVYFLNIWDIATQVVLLCSVPLSYIVYEPDCTRLTLILTKLLLVCLLFILEMACTAGSACHLKKN